MYLRRKSFFLGGKKSKYKANTVPDKTRNNPPHTKVKEVEVVLAKIDILGSKTERCYGFRQPLSERGA